MSKELNHFGILGMKWGRRKGGKMTVSDAKKREKQRAKILSSPDKLLKNLDKFSEPEIKKAMDRMRLERDLRSLSRDNLTRGTTYANAILGYGTTAVTAYGIYKSPLGQKIKEMVIEALRERVTP